MNTNNKQIPAKYIKFDPLKVMCTGPTDIGIVLIVNHKHSLFTAKHVRSMSKYMLRVTETLRAGKKSMESLDRLLAKDPQAKFDFYYMPTVSRHLTNAAAIEMGEAGFKKIISGRAVDRDGKQQLVLIQFSDNYHVMVYKNHYETEPVLIERARRQLSSLIRAQRMRERRDNQLPRGTLSVEYSVARLVVAELFVASVNTLDVALPTVNNSVMVNAYNASMIKDRAVAMSKNKLHDFKAPDVVPFLNQYVLGRI